MPTEIEIKREIFYTETEYGCSFCEKKFRGRDLCFQHEWDDHHRQNTEVHEETAWEEDFLFRHFPDLVTFGGFAAATPALRAQWAGPGWYRQYAYQDRDNNDAIGLRFMEDGVCAWWLPRTDFPILFGAGASFEKDGVLWEARACPTDDAITIYYASPASLEPYSSDDVMLAWKAWMSAKSP